MQLITRRKAPRFAWIVVAWLAAAVVCSAQVTFTEYPIPTAAGAPSGITKGPDGNIWFTELSGNKIGNITTTGAITEYSIPTANSAPAEITTGSDGNLWFTEYFGQRIGKITTAGVITEFSIPSGDSLPYGIAAGPDGNLWFTENDGHILTASYVGKITTNGVITLFPLAGGSEPAQIAKGPDGNMWFAENGGNQIGRITPSGVITEFPIPSGAFAIALGPDGNLWFGGNLATYIGKITPAGVITVFPLPSGSTADSFAANPDGNMWFVDYYTSQLGRITTSGVITEFPTPTANAGPNEITTGSDGNLWFTEGPGNNIDKVVIGPRYNVCPLYDPTKAVKSGATIPIKLELCDAGGNDLSSSSITVHADTIIQVSTQTTGPVLESGNSNPDDNFRFDATLGSAGGYIFNLKTTGLPTGTFNLNFTVPGDSASYSTLFQVK